MNTWRISDLVVDAVRNVSASLVRTALVAAAAAAAVAALVLVELTTTEDLLTHIFSRFCLGK